MLCEFDLDFSDVPVLTFDTPDRRRMADGALKARPQNNNLSDALKEAGVPDYEKVAQLSSDRAATVCPDDPEKAAKLSFIFAFTFDFDDPSKAGKNPYQLLNRGLSSEKTMEVDAVRKFLWGLLEGLRMEPPVPHEHLYRSLRTKVELSVGQTWSWPAFSSCTVAQDAAMKFLNYESGQATGTMINIVGASGFHIDKYSFISSEKEVLLEPGLSFIVRSIIPGPTNIVEVEYDKESQRMLIAEIPQQGVTDEKEEGAGAGYGRVETKIEMGVRYCGSKKYKKAMEAFKDALKEDSAAMAAINIGFCYLYGLGVDRDVAQGLKMWNKAGKEAKESTRTDWRKDPCVFSVISPDVLDLHGCAFGKRDVKIFAALIEEKQIPPSLVLYDTGLTPEQLSIITSAIKNSPAITSLDVSYNALTSECIKSVFSSLEGLENLKSLNLSHNNIDDDAVDTLLSIIAKLDLEQLDLSDNLLTGSSLSDIFEEIESNSSITSLSLSGNECSTGALKQLGSTLSENTTLKTLNISSCKITSKIPKEFVSALNSMSTLTALNLGDNFIEDEGLAKIADHLDGNKSLEYLNLCSNGITEVSMDSMSKFLSGSSIRILNLSMNNLGDEGAKTLIKGIRECKNLEEVYLQSVGIGSAGKETLSEIPKTMKNVKRLSFW